MELTIEELSRLSSYTKVFRNDCERQIRRLRRNKDMLIERFNEIPADIAEESGIIHPDDEINDLKNQKAEAVIINKKIALLLNKTRK